MQTRAPWTTGKAADRIGSGTVSWVNGHSTGSWRVKEFVLGSEAYYIRIRSRVSGPYTLSDLRRLVARGRISRLHEISPDQTEWTLAATFGQLFPPPEAPGSTTSVRHLGSGVVASEAEALRTPAGELDPASPDGGDEYYYILDGKMKGPVSRNDLRSLAATTTLHPDDLVAKTGDKEWVRAQEFPELASNDQSQLSESVASTREFNNMEPDNLGASAIAGDRQTAKLALSSGVSASVLLLFCVHIPHDRAGDGLRWWWDLNSTPGSAHLGRLCGFIVLIALSLLFVSFLLRGAHRAWTYMSFSVAGLSWLIMSSWWVARSEGPLFVGLLVPLACCALWALTRRRASKVDDASGNGLVTLIALAVIVATSAATVACAWVFIQSGSSGDTSLSVPPVSILLAAVGFAASLSCGIVGLTGNRKMRSRSGPLVIVVLTIVATLCLMVAGLVLGYRAGTGGDAGSRFLFLQVLRCLICSLVFDILFAVGLLELAVCRRAISSSIGTPQITVTPVEIQ